MSDESIILNGKDCSKINNQKGHANALQYFISKSSDVNIFRFDPANNNEDIEIAYFNSRDAQWYAGRMVGESTFTFENKQYKLRIEPRFGHIQLFRMLEEIYNIRLTDSQSAIGKHVDYQVLIKRLIAFMWMSMLAKANKHGVPRNNVFRSHKGSIIRGRLHARKSMISYFTENQVVSEYREKEADQKVVKILNRAYEILMLEYGLAKIRQPIAAKNAIEQIKSSVKSYNFISERDFQSIRLKSIYSSYKSILDLSWDIIKKKDFGNHDSQKDGNSFFIDMAELWELYLRSIIKKRFVSEGWTISSPKSYIYSEKDFKRSIIPDIVLQKGNQVLVFDAKYKNMGFHYFDYDRADFFQIHTYIQYYQQKGKVIAGGLLYPLSAKFDEERMASNFSASLFDENGSSTKFIVDGIDLSNITSLTIKNAESQFLNRIALLTLNNDYEFNR